MMRGVNKMFDPLDIIGKIYGGVIPTIYLGEEKPMMTKNKNARGRKHLYQCTCSICGKIKVVSRNVIINKAKKSCGCFAKGKKKQGIGKSHTLTYRTWNSMMQRCTNPKNKDARRYMHRGIKVCERWKDFENFAADMGERPKGASIDRINNDGNYEPGNCRWILEGDNTQQNNKSNNRVFTYKGETKTIAQWEKETGFPIRARLNLGWTIERAITQEKGTEGSKNNSAKINDSIVLDIRKMHKSGAGLKKIAKHFGISRCSVWLIATGRGWKHVLSNET
jgi:hypothetical protein